MGKKTAHKLSVRLILLTTLTASFMVVEFVVGYLFNSLALVSDSFHMLSDVLALVVALWARRFSKKDKSETMTYGWRRAEVVGALMNGVFLLALCLNLAIEAIQRFFAIEKIEQPVYVLGVGGAGLCINIIGLFLFHSHHDGGHSHGHGHDHKHGHKHRNSNEMAEDNIIASGDSEIEAPNVPPTTVMKKKHANMNVRGVFLHVLGDALGSIGVIISALIIWLTSWKQRYYVDPIMSLIIVAIILKSTIPLVLRAAKILLQAVPEEIDIKKMKLDLNGVVDVIDIHEIHIWQLSNDLLVASLHITCFRSCNFMEMANSLKAILHTYGIHATTIQPEFVDDSFKKEGDSCLLRCDTKCEEISCCSKRKPTATIIISSPEETNAK